MQARTTSRGTALTIAGMYFLLLLDGAILNTSLPRMAQSLAVPTLSLSSAISAYLLAMAATIPLSPWAAQRFGGRRVYLMAVALFTLSSLACGLADDLSLLVAARVLQGAAGGLMVALGRILALQKAPKSELMSITALLVWPALLAPVVGPPLGGFITTYFSWRWNFLMNLPLGALGLWSIWCFIPADDAGERRRTGLDWPGALMTALGLGALLAGLEAVARGVTPGERQLAWALIALGVVVLALDVRHLLRSAAPLISLAPLRVRTFTISTLAAGTFSAMCLQATPYLLPLMFQLAFGLSAVAAGSLLLPYFLGNLLMKTVTTPILRRFGFRRVMLLDGVIAMAAIGACGLLGPRTSYAMLAALLLVAGAARSMLLTAINTLSLADIEIADRGSASTLAAVSAQLSAVLGVALSTGLLLLLGQPGSTPALRDFQWTFAGLGLIGLVSVAGYLRIRQADGAEVSGHGQGSATVTDHQEKTA